MVTKTMIYRYPVWLILLSSCIDPFPLNIENAQGKLIVESSITNEAIPYTVKLFKSGDFSDPIIVSGAQVSIEDDLGRVLQFAEVGNGFYQSDPSLGLTGQIGRIYILNILTPDGNQYRSNPEMMAPVPDIDSLFIETTERLILSDKGTEISTLGINVMVNTHTNENQFTFLKWDYRSLYQVQTPTPCPLCTFFCDVGDVRPAEYLNIQGTDKIVNIPLDRIPIQFIIPDFRFARVFTFSVKQFSLNSNAFEYWEAVEDQRKNSGTIFDPPPNILVSNIFNVNESKEDVLGYFVVSAVAQRELVLRSEDLRALGFEVNFPLPDCNLQTRDPRRPAYCNNCVSFPNSGASLKTLWDE